MFIELLDHPDLTSSGGAKCLDNAGTLRSSGAEELLAATSSINIWPLCGQEKICWANFINNSLVKGHQSSLGRPALSNNLYLFVYGFIKGRFSLKTQSAGAKTHDSFVVDQNVSGKFINSEGPLHLAVAIAEL